MREQKRAAATGLTNDPAPKKRRRFTRYQSDGDASPPAERLWRDDGAESFFDVPRGTMKRARYTGKPPLLAAIPFVRLGKYVRYRPQDCHEAAARHVETVGKGEPKTEHEGAS